jgi:LysM repeat protein
LIPKGDGGMDKKTYCFLHRVGETETYFQIARHYGISPESLIRANPQVKGAYTLYPGQFIGIPVESGVDFNKRANR